MKTISKNSLVALFFSMFIFLGMSCSTLSDRHPDSMSDEQLENRWANPTENRAFERIQSR